MLELLMTSHGSSESCGFKQGTGCSRGLRAIAPQMQEVRKYRPPWEERKKREEKKYSKIGGRGRRNRKGKGTGLC